MKHILLTLFMIPLCFTSEKVETYPPVIVLELFTSQGCSSCPPADKLLTEVDTFDNENQIITLSYHVDYWNYIGWKDPFSKASFSDKQRQYSRKFNSSSIYTPQVVVNGKTHFVGSNTREMNAKLKSYAKISAENKIELSVVKRSGNSVSFNYNIAGAIKNKTMRIVLAIKERTTEIPRGENRNRTLKNSNIVVLDDALGLKKSNGSYSFSIPKIVNKEDKLKLIVMSQNSDLDIIGASQVNL
ncbi:thioredoxin family protein [uncultured Psychroserpens sp.]|uniref:DUF1223 domain-containing protein n=1 Tax=uncultured Psychroserpens sp. TaxID=255436 RepID=UPI00260A1B97|nr:DUF1223 domain-containing protein [uncultured Psychroserpens sp.]